MARSLVTVALAVALVAAMPVPALRAQSAAPAEPGNDARAGCMMMSGGMMPGGMMPGGMMGEGRDQARPMLGMRMMHGLDHVEGRLAFLKAELKITDAQAAQWAKFADALRAIDRSSAAEVHPMVRDAGPSATARFEAIERGLSTHLDAVRNIRAAFEPLYGALSDDQKKMADELVEPMAIGL